jgi:hypothetical protein
MTATLTPEERHERYRQSGAKGGKAGVGSAKARDPKMLARARYRYWAEVRAGIRPFPVGVGRKRKVKPEDGQKAE